MPTPFYRMHIYRKYAHPPGRWGGVKMPCFSGKTAENVMGVYGFDCAAIFLDWSAHIFRGWQRVCWCTNKALNQASPTKEFWENCPQKKDGHIYSKNEGWACLRKLLYMLSLSFCGCGYHFHPDHHQFNGSGRKVGNKKLCTSRLIIDCGLFPEGARRPRILHLQRQISSSSSLLVYILLLPNLGLCYHLSHRR